MATQKKVETVEREELNLDKKITLRNLTNWPTSITRTDNKSVEIMIVPYGSIRLERGEVIAQSQTNNRDINGTDGKGSHATIYIEDEPTRIELGFDSPDGKRKQLVFSDELVKEIFDIKKQDEFEKRFKETFSDTLEKYAVIDAIKRLGINDYAKIRFAERSTGLTIE